MTKNNFLVLALVLVSALTLILTLTASTESVSAGAQTKSIHLTVVDDVTGNKVSGATCGISTDVGFAQVTTDGGGHATATVADSGTVAFFISCFSAAGSSGGGPFPLNANGTTNVTITV